MNEEMNEEEVNERRRKRKPVVDERVVFASLKSLLLIHPLQHHHLQ